VYFLTTYLATGLFVQLMKRLFFEDMVRPAGYFQDLAQLHVVEGVVLLSSRSFPSGHATTAFALFLCLALLLKSRFMKLICFLLASLAAFSRVYLSQHFLIDVYAGSIIGCIGALAFYPVFFREDRKWHAWTVLKLFRYECKG
jgi:membrane-associated phospholipid phosphatase